jgi:hypothetical protein
MVCFGQPMKTRVFETESRGLTEQVRDSVSAPKSILLRQSCACTITGPLVFSCPMRELDIRRALRKHLGFVFEQDPTALILEELGVCRGTVRVDMAVVTGTLKGFEIKSDQDTLKRLPVQASAYNKVFDTLTIVVGARHLQAIASVVPPWWGILVLDDRLGNEASLQFLRPESLNPDLDGFALVQLLWRDEALALLQAKGLGAGLKSKPRRYLWEALAENLALSDLREVVRTQLKARQGWRSAALQRPDGVTSLPSATLLDYRSPRADSRIHRYTSRPN